MSVCLSVSGVHQWWQDHVDQEPHHPYHLTRLPASYPSLKSDMIPVDPLQPGVST